MPPDQAKKPPPHAAGRSAAQHRPDRGDRRRRRGRARARSSRSSSASVGRRRRRRRAKQTQPVAGRGHGAAAVRRRRRDDPAIGQTPPTLEGKSFDGSPRHDRPRRRQAEARRVRRPLVPALPGARCRVIVEWAAAGLIPAGLEVYGGVHRHQRARRPNYPPSSWLERERLDRTRRWPTATTTPRPRPRAASATRTSWRVGGRRQGDGSAPAAS